MIKKKYKVMIIISLRVWIIRAFIIKVYGILIVNVLLKMNLIVLGMCDFNVSMNWLFLGGLCHNGFPLDLDDHKIKRSRHRSFLYGCDWSLGMHVLKLGIEIPNLKQNDWSTKLIWRFWIREYIYAWGGLAPSRYPFENSTN